MAREGRGLGAYLTAIRIVFGNPLLRGVLRLAMRKVRCRYDGEVVEASIIEHALAKMADVNVQCPYYATIIIKTIDTVIEKVAKSLGGNREVVKNAVADPAVRRGVALVIEGIARYGVTVPQKLPAPFLVVWNFTNMCNMRCKHCYQRADKPLPNELSLEEKLRLIDDLDRAGVAAVALSGGEPTIHPHFFRVVKELADRGIYVAVATNGWVFAEREKLEKAVKLGLRYVEVSLDSAKPWKHDEFRGVRGAWERAVKALRNAVELGINHAMAVTVTRTNIDEIEDILDLAESIGVKRVVFFNFVPVGRGRENAWLDLTPEEREELLRTLYREMRRRKLEIESTAPQYARIVLEESGGKEVMATHFTAEVRGDPVIRAIAEYIGGCGAGRIYAAIQPDGTVTPCVFMPIPVGNIRVKSFREIWEEAPLFQKLRDRSLLKGACATCPYKLVCGGCRARAFAYTGDPLGPDPGCIMNKAYYEAIVGRGRMGVREGSFRSQS